MSSFAYKGRKYEISKGAQKHGKQAVALALGQINGDIKASPNQLTGKIYEIIEHDPDNRYLLDQLGGGREDRLAAIAWGICALQRRRLVKFTPPPKTVRRKGRKSHAEPIAQLGLTGSRRPARQQRFAA